MGFSGACWSRIRIWDWMETSSALTGSSAMISSGSNTSARAMPMRWRWPPLNSCGNFSMLSGGSPTSDSSLITTRSLMPERVRDSVHPHRFASVCPTVRRGFSEEYGSWKMICIRRRSARSRLASAADDIFPRSAPAAGIGFHQAQDTPADRGLAAAGLTHQAEGVARLATLKETWSTARTVIVTGLGNPRLIRKNFCQGIDLKQCIRHRRPPARFRPCTQQRT